MSGKKSRESSGFWCTTSFDPPPLAPSSSSLCFLPLRSYTMSPLSPPPPPPPLPGLLHTYSLTPHLTAFQHPPLSPTGVILFVPGLGDTLSSVQYTTSLAKALEDSGKGWCLVQVGLSSAGGGWGTGTVRRDAEELRECVSYWREEREVDKIVVMGHSTGKPFFLLHLS